jgi:hypothetical protein
MKVIDHQPQAWFLFEDDGELYLDANCSNSFVGYSVVIALNVSERSAYAAQGGAFLDGLAASIQDSGAGVVETSPFTARNLGVGYTALKQRISEAVRAWKAAQPDSR